VIEVLIVEGLMVDGCMVKRYSDTALASGKSEVFTTPRLYTVQHVLYDKMLFNQTSCHTQGPGPAANLPI
jgi:hypothetical protein